MTNLSLVFWMLTSFNAGGNTGVLTGVCTDSYNGLKAQPGSSAKEETVITGPSAIGTLELRSRQDSKPGYALRYSDLDMDFVLVPSADSTVWKVSRPAGSVMARYAWTPDGMLRLLNGLERYADEDLPAGNPGGNVTAASATGEEPGANQYRPVSPDQTWLFDYETLRKQQKGIDRVARESAARASAEQYAELLVASLTRGPRPLLPVNLMQEDWPEPFCLIGLPAYDERPAQWWTHLRQAESRKQEGSFLSGNFAIVSPDLGISMAASSGWIALASAAYSPAEGFIHKGPVPYNMALGQDWSQATGRLPAYWTYLQRQSAGTEGANYIYTTPILPGLAMILTRSADTLSLIGVTLVYQPYMKGVASPSMLPPVPRQEEVAYYIRTLFWNAHLDWALWGDESGSPEQLTPPGFIAATKTAGSGLNLPLTGGRFFESQFCPGSESPVQRLCAEALARQVHSSLPQDYRFQVIFKDREGRPLSDPASKELAAAEWIIYHQQDEGLIRNEFHHPHLVIIFSQTAGPAGEMAFSDQVKLELVIYAAQERF